MCKCLYTEHYKNTKSENRISVNNVSSLLRKYKALSTIQVKVIPKYKSNEVLKYPTDTQRHHYSCYNQRKDHHNITLAYTF